MKLSTVLEWISKRALYVNLVTGTRPLCVLIIKQKRQHGEKLRF